jgi:hypothetical protein
MTDEEALRMPYRRQRSFIRYQNQYVKQIEKATRK